MKAKLFSLTAALSFLLLLSTIPSFAQLPTTCSNALLRGDYGVTVDGKIIPPGAAAFVAQQGVALRHYDGEGNFTQVDFIMTNGAPAINPQHWGQLQWLPDERERYVHGESGLHRLGNAQPIHEV
jgi:hypothetical protein